MVAWQWWCAAALALMILEMLTPGFLLACFGLSAMASAIGALLGLGFRGQWLIFSAAGVALMFALRPFVLRYLSRGDLKSNADALVGQRATVVSEIGFDGGYVDLQGTRWLARPQDDSVIAAGATVRVLSVGGASLIVGPDEPESGKKN